jgi:hypothetical protein
LKGSPQTELLGEKTRIKSTGGITGKQYEQALEHFKKTDPEGFAVVENARQKYYAIQRDILKQTYEGGLIPEKTYNYLLENHKNYHPRTFIQHIDPAQKGISGLGAKGIDVGQSGIKALDEGSEQAMINNPMYAIEQAEIRLQARLSQNRANKQLFDYVTKSPENALGGKLFKSETDIPSGYRPVHFFDKGVKKVIGLPRQVAKFWVTADPAVNATFGHFLGMITGAPVLKAMATGYNPEFAIANVFRDQALSWFSTQEFSPVLPTALFQYVNNVRKTLPDIVKGGPKLQQFIKEHGETEYLTKQGYLMSEDPTAMTSATGEAMKQVQDVTGWVGMTSERMTRMALREQAIANGKPSEVASWIAARYIDFSQAGTWMKEINKVIPYSNPGVQGARSIIRAFRENPKLATFKAAQLATLGGGIAWWMHTHHGDLMDKISDREKVTRWIIPLPWMVKDKKGGETQAYLGIPKDQGMRIFSTFGEVTAELAMGKISGEKAWSKMKMAIGDFAPVDVGSQILPPAVSAWVGYINNRDFWMKQEMWKGPKVKPSEEYWPQTPQIYKTIGQATGLSPERLRQAGQKIFTQNIYTDGGETLWDVLNGKDVSVTSPTQIPFVRKLIRTPSTTTGSQPIKEAVEQKSMEQNRKALDLYARAQDYVKTVEPKAGEGPKKQFSGFWRQEHTAARSAGERVNRAQVYRAFEKAYAAKELSPEEREIYKAPSLAAREAAIDKYLEQKGITGDATIQKKRAMKRRYSLFTQGEK